VSDIDYGQMSDVESNIPNEYTEWPDADLLQSYNAPYDEVLNPWDQKAIEDELRYRNLLS